jgi:hypothetical protein
MAGAGPTSGSGDLTNLPALGGRPVTVGTLDGVSAARLFGKPREQGSNEGCSSPGGMVISAVKGYDRYLRCIQNGLGSTVSHSERPIVGVRMTGRLLVGHSRVCGSVATQLRSAGVWGGQLQRRRGLDWLRQQVDSGGRLHVNRSGSKRMTGEVQRQ